MNRGILIVGLNGAGKTTLGRVLADALGWFRMDVEDYFFTPADNPYAVSRTKDEVRQLMLADIERHGRFVLSSVSGDWGEALAARVGAVVVLDAPLETRLVRIDRRSVARFGSRVMPGGDMYDQERRFRDFATARSERIIEDWLETVKVPILRLDATLSADAILDIALRWLKDLSFTEDRHART